MRYCVIFGAPFQSFCILTGTVDRLLMSWIKRIAKLEKTGMKILSYQSKNPLSVFRKFNGTD